ncbi:saccharopine dehydrogenase NADP-binding domain-containing protein [Aquiflexum sp. TKW24L]|uniref:saccharopine dehydrogenase C-terminal domain-containing protein n=1 Tax=Aquiflexum sp. TKW24L TaxID=2942212 RepID=UPI0020BD6138|nr:saccharopine dehydrogenase C-terminal domain-containing protein [Aquiflexum sp. TKW24L]MCL6257789.1 saccharopine dehydrogenase NADP-binding domain-containing protein [Aquiflexum sp. TKW24L]
MQTILILGAGKSSTYLIEYLLESAGVKSRKIIVADILKRTAAEKIKGSSFASAVSINITNQEERNALIQKSDLVVSMLPASMHPIIAKDCLTLGKHFFTASYESDELRKLANDIKAKNLLFLNECGLDPGIDHMSAMKIIDHQKAKGNEIISFKSFCGGILSPESEDNPWKYKFTWNPRNVVLAGQGVSRYIQNAQLKFIPYHKLFERTEKINFEDVGDFDGYANRDSLRYREIYGLEKIPTMLRGTLRRAGFCQAWNVFVQLGMTDDTFQVDFPNGVSYRGFLNSFLPYHPTKTVEEKLQAYLPNMDLDTMPKIEWLGLFSDNPVPISKGSPATILQKILEEKWQLSPDDKDMIVLQHQFEVKGGKVNTKIVSSLVCKGQNEEYTAMAKTVGLPLAMAVDLFLDGKIKSRGLQIPVQKEFYDPILKALEGYGIFFQENQIPKNE